MSRGKLPRINVGDLPLNEQRIIELLDLSRAVARTNGNTTWQRPLKLLTVDRDQALSTLIGYDKSHSINHAQALGICWPHSGVIWVKPQVTRGNHVGNIATMCHEVAHLLAAGGHARTWRRMYMMLYPLWQRGLNTYNTKRPVNIYHESVWTVNMYYKASRLPEEQQTLAKNRAVSDLTDRAFRSLDRWREDLDMICCNRHTS